MTPAHRGALPAVHREIRLAARPGAQLEPEHFETARVPLRRPAAGEVLVRNVLLRIGAATRTLIVPVAWRAATTAEAEGLPTRNAQDAINAEAENYPIISTKQPALYGPTCKGNPE